ncbi:hypothetical protein D915_003394 [Fasciola hepatica]|uniref:Uncharacterized protein n=1 Tax=Fasciola hepatica TaxID=6192 RepID=A0A4E0S2B0_FASHE|nr:hypothetical protein D915_003394 [Fasciola hepatica]
MSLRFGITIWILVIACGTFSNNVYSSAQMLIPEAMQYRGPIGSVPVMRIRDGMYEYHKRRPGVRDIWKRWSPVKEFHYAEPIEI